MELGRRLGVKQPTAWAVKHKIMAVMARREGETRLTGRVEMDDAYLGGVRSGGKRGRGAAGKTPFVAAVSTSPEGRPRKLKLAPVKGFRKREIARGAKHWLAPGAAVVTDGLGCWSALDEAACSHQAIRTGSGRQAARMASFKWVNTTLGNIKSAITGTYRKLGPDHAGRYLASFAWRYNRRYQLQTMIPRFVHSAARTQPLPYRLLIAGCLSGISRNIFMLKEVLIAFREAAYFVGLALKGLCFWRKPPPLTTPGELRIFIERRAKAVTQVTLFGYLKTRAGTRYTSLFEDDVFANSISIAIMEIYLAALSDLTVFAAARVGRDAGAGAEETRSLALCLHNNILGDEEIPEYRPQGFDAARQAFSERAAETPWPEMAQGEAAFRGSLAALVEWAPVAPELKDKDTEIVKNSMRFRWKAVRDQFADILDAPAVMAAWRDELPHTAASAEIAAPAN